MSDEQWHDIMRQLGLVLVVLLVLIGVITVVFLLAGYDLAPQSRICR